MRKHWKGKDIKECHMHLDDPSAKKRNDGVSQENFKFMAELLQQEIMANNH